MSAKPIVPVFATVPDLPEIPLFAGGEQNKADPVLPLAQESLSIGTQWHLAVGLILLLLILVAYGNSFQSEWVLDNKYIIELDPRTKSVQWDDLPGKPGVRNIFTQDYWWPKGISGLYRPITSFTYWLNWTVFRNGHNPTPREQVVGFHWINLGVHFLNAFLFYRLMLRLTRRFWVSFFAAAVFAMHPVATESVTNIIGRADMFAATTVVGGMLLYIDVHRNRGWKKIACLLGLALLTVTGMFSKESTIAVGLVIVAYDLIYRVGDRLRSSITRESALFAMRIVLIAAIFFCAVRIYVNQIVPWMGGMETGSAKFAFTLIGAVGAMVGLFVSMALIATRRPMIYLIPLLTSAVLLTALGAVNHPKLLFLAGLIASSLAFAAAEICFQMFWPEEQSQPDALAEPASSWTGFFDGYFVLLPALILMLCVRHWIFENTTPAEEPFLDNPLRGLGFIGSRMTAFKVWARLFWKLIYPIHLSSDYSYNEIPLFGYPGTTLWQNFECVLAMFCFFGLLFLAFWCWKKGQKAIAFFILLFFINYIPTGNFLYIIGSIMAERFMYLPLIGFSAVLVIGVDLVFRKWVGRLDDVDTFATASQPESPQAVVATKYADPIATRATARLDYRFVPHILLSLLVVLYGIRAFARNYAWHTDVTLWTSAQQLSQKSFRSYQSLAFALFEQDAAGNCDRMIDVDEQGLTIVDDLPNPNNSSRLYLHLGMYYGLKGELLSKQVPGGIEVTKAAIPWFQKSAAILERGVPIDRAFNEVNRARDVKRGRNGNETADVGLAPVYSYLAIAYQRLGMLDQAERTIRYMRHLEPTDADSYMKLANVQAARGRAEDAAVSLMQCILLDGTRSDAWSGLNEMFKQINQERYPCIILSEQGRAQLDLSRAAVQSTVLQAYRDFVKTFLISRRPQLAQNAADTAVNVYKFNRKAYFDPLFDPAYLAQFGIPVPPDPSFYKPKPVSFELMLPQVKNAFIDETGMNDFGTLEVQIVDGRAIYWKDIRSGGQTRRIRVSEEGKVLPGEPAH